jgi:hypothetical protein
MKRKKGGGRTWRCARLVTGWCLSANGDLDLVSWAYMWKQLWARGRAWSVLNSWLVWFNVYCVLPAGKRCGGFDALQRSVGLLLASKIATKMQLWCYRAGED